METECEEMRKDFKSEVDCAKKTKRKKSLLKKKISDLKLKSELENIKEVEVQCDQFELGECANMSMGESIEIISMVQGV